MIMYCRLCNAGISNFDASTANSKTAIDRQYKGKIEDEKHCCLA